MSGAFVMVAEGLRSIDPNTPIKEITTMRTVKSKSLREGARSRTSIRISSLSILCCAVAGFALSNAPVQANSDKRSGENITAASVADARLEGGRYLTIRHTHAIQSLNTQSDSPGSADPVPIPGGDAIPGFGVIHNFLSGPSTVTFEGIPLDGADVEPGGITDFRGLVAQSYIGGTAKGNDGNSYDMACDIRVCRGQYVSSDGTRRRGTFVFI